MPAKPKSSQTRKTVTTTVTKGPVKPAAAAAKGGKKSLVPYLLAGLVVIGLIVGLVFFFRSRKDDDGTKAPSGSTSGSAFCAVDANCAVLVQGTGTAPPLTQAQSDQLRNAILGIDGVSAPSAANQTILDGQGIEIPGGEILFVEADTNLLNLPLADILVDLDLADLSQGAIALTLFQTPILQAGLPGLTGDGDLVQIVAVPVPEGSSARGKTPEELAASQAPGEVSPEGAKVVVPRSLFGGTCPSKTC